MTHLNPIVELNFATRVNADMLQRLSSLIIGLSTGLQCLENRDLVYTSGGIRRDGTTGRARRD